MNNELRKVILSDLLKCSYCGFCEWICPTQYAKDNYRVFGPRGRVNMIILFLREGLWSDILVESIYTCLLCKACTTQCPAGIEIEKDIRLFRQLLEIENVIK